MGLATGAGCGWMSAGLSRCVVAIVVQGARSKVKIGNEMEVIFFLVSMASLMAWWLTLGRTMTFPVA